MPTFLARCLALVAALAFVAPAVAGLFSVTPVRIFMTPRDRATAITVTNEGDEELVMQADVYAWKQKPGGEDDLVLSEDLVVSPPILKLAPRARQVVRLASLQPVTGPSQATYRVVMREIPEARKDPKSVELQVALAFSLPVFITPAGARRDFSCTGSRIAADALRVSCTNSGQTYVQVREFTLTGPAGQKLAARENAAYLLPGTERSTELRRGDGPIPAGRLKLDVALDDGSSRAFELAIAD